MRRKREERGKMRESEGREEIMVSVSRWEIRD